MSKNRRKKRRDEERKTCEHCDHACYIGEGDTICLAVAEGPFMIKSDFMPTDGYFTCQGRKWVKA